jgi:hypothetical protein
LHSLLGKEHGVGSRAGPFWRGSVLQLTQNSHGSRLMAADSTTVLDQRVVRAAEATLRRQQFVTAVDVLGGLGWLPMARVDEWRQGRISTSGMRCRSSRRSSRPRYAPSAAGRKGTSSSRVRRHTLPAPAIAGRCASLRAATPTPSVSTRLTGSRLSFRRGTGSGSSSGLPARPIWSSSRRSTTGRARGDQDRGSGLAFTHFSLALPLSDEEMPGLQSLRPIRARNFISHWAPRAVRASR